MAFEYQPQTDSKGKEVKISDLEKNVYDSASKVMNNTKESHNLADFVSKLSRDTGIQYEFTTTEDLKSRGYNVGDNAVINGLNSDDGKVFINIDSDSIVNRVVGHETTHLFENTEDYKTLQNAVFEYAKTKGDFDKLKAELTEAYKNVKGANIDNELTSEFVGQYVFSDTEFVQNLSKHRNIFQKIYDEIKHLYKMATAGSKEARQLEKVKRTFEKVYQNNEANSINKATFSIQTDKNGNKYVKVDTDQDIFKGIQEKDYNKVAKMYINDYLLGTTKLSNNDIAVIDKKSANKYTNPGKRQTNFNEKMKLTPELKNVLKISTKVSSSAPTKANTKYSSWEYYDTIFELDGKTFTARINIGIDKNGNKHFYEINKIKKTSGILGTSPNNPTGFSANNVSQSNNNVKSNTSTRYSISKVENYNFNSKYEINQEIKRLNSLIYSENSYSLEEKNNFKEQVKQLKELRKNYNDTPIAPLPNNQNSNFSIDDMSTYNNYTLTKADNKAIDGIAQKIVNNVNDKINVEQNYIDEMIENEVPIIEELKSNDIDFDDYQYNIYQQVQDKVNDELSKEGISQRYDENNDKTFYDRQELAVKGYNEMLDYFDKNGIKYEVSRSTEAGYVPSIYIKDSDGNTIMRIGNHDNGYVDDYDMVYDSAYNTLFDDRDYANWKENIIPRVEQEIGKINNTENSNTSSFSVEQHKQQQLDIIQNNNPVNDDYHTWIRNTDDIKTFEETLQDDDWSIGDDFDPDYTWNMAQEALDSGKITVYSSYPIEQGIFVTPSKMEAESYSGIGKVYSKIVNLQDVAWIDPTQGQYAKVDNTQYSLNNDNLVPLQEGEVQSQDVRNKNRSIAPLPTNIQNQTNTQNTNVSNNTEVVTPSNNTQETTSANKTLNPTEIAQIKPENANTTPKIDNIKVSTGDGKSHFFDNIKDKVNMLSEDSKAKILSNDEVKYYKEVTNEDSLNKAFTKLADNGEVETRAWFNKASEKATDVDVAEGWILMKQYEDVGDYDGMVQVAKKMREIGTKAGQTVQAFNIMNRMTPEGMVKYAQSELSEAYEQMIKGKTKKWIDQHRSDFELKPEEVKFIMDNMQEVSTMPDGYDKKVKLAEIQKLMTDKIPPAKGQGIKAWMRISMLFNPKTQVRNVAGNALIAPVNAFGDLFASGVDRLVARKTGVRTVGKTSLKNYSKGMIKGLFESYNDFKKGINTRNISGNRFEIGEGKSFNEKTMIGKSLNRVDSLLSFMLDAGDRMFYEGSFVNSINNQMVLNNTDTVTQDMIDIATQEALSRTWQDNNKYTQFVLSVRRMMNNINVKGYGLGDVLIPFAKTPANLTKALVDYSPAGMVTTLIKGYDLKKSINNGQYTAQMQHDFAQSLGKATAGTMLYVLGYALAKAGIISGESDDDKDVTNFMKNTMGVNSYSIKIGDKSFTYDWAQPIAGPFSMMANLVNKQDQEASLGEKITSTLDTAGNIILEQSFMESINTVLSNNDGIATGIEEAILDLPSRAIPTFMKQITDMVDGTQRVSFEYDKPLESAINSVKAKIPGLSQTLAPSVDSMGREIQKYGGKNNIFNVFFNPANVANENVSESAKEIYRVYKQTGDSTILPRVAPYYVNSDGEKIILNSKQREKLQKKSGQVLEKSLDNMMKSDTYRNASDENKAEMINGLVNYSYNIAQHEVVGTDLSQTYKKAYNFANNGGDIENYYIYKFDTKDMGSNEKEKYLYNSNLSDDQKTLLYENVTLSDFSDESKYLDYKTSKLLGIDINNWLNYSSQEFKSDIAPTGKTISGSRKKKLISFVNSLNLTIPQKASLIKMSYSSYDNYDKQIMNEVNSLNISFMDKAKMVKTLGFDEYDDSIINYVDKNYSSMSEKTDVLKDLGFTVYTYKGRTYVR